MDSPLALFWDCKNSPNLYGMDHKCSCVLAIEFDFKKWNRGWTSVLPMDSPLLGFGIVKISPGLCKLDKNHPCVVCLNC